MIIIHHGRFIAGRPNFRYQHNLTLTLYGNFFSDQLPEFGNKVLGCHNCHLDLHGKEKLPTWSQLWYSVNISATSLGLQDKVNWEVGDFIVISSTDFDHTHSECVQLTSISEDKRVVTFQPALRYSHYGEDEFYGGV